MIRRAVLLLGLAAATVACGGGDDATADSAAPSTTATTATTTPAIEQRIGIVDLVVGQCWNDSPHEEDEDLVVLLAECSDPHMHEVYDQLEYEAGEDSLPGAPFPGELAVKNYTEQACEDRFEPWVGLAWELSELDIVVHRPTRQAWETTDERTITCSVVAFDGDMLTGTMQGAAV